MRGTAAGSHPRQGLRTVHVAPAGASLPSAVAASLRKSRPGQGAEAECFLAACLYATEPDSPCSRTGGLSLRVHGLEIPATALSPCHGTVSSLAPIITASVSGSERFLLPCLPPPGMVDSGAVLLPSFTFHHVFTELLLRVSHLFRSEQDRQGPCCHSP